MSIKQEHVRRIEQYLDSTGVPHRPTSTIRPASSQTAAGNLSCHAADNLGCHAVDYAAVTWGRDTPELFAIFRAFEPVEHLLHELIYAGPEVTYNVKRGKRVAPYAQAGHHDHVHVAIRTGTVLPLRPSPPAPPPQPAPLEDDMPTVTAQDLAMNPNGSGQGYVLDAHGGIHAVGGAPKANGNPYWKPEKGIAPARRLVITDWSDPPKGYILDALGGIHPFGGAPPIPEDQRPYWPRGFVPPTVQM